MFEIWKRLREEQKVLAPQEFDADQRSARWTEITKQIRNLLDEKLDLEKKMRDEFIKSHTQLYSLPVDADLNWREPVVVIKTGTRNQVVIDLMEVEFSGILNGRNSKRHPKGSKFTVLRSWKKGKTKGTHYLLYDKKSKRVANFYG